MTQDDETLASRRAAVHRMRMLRKVGKSAVQTAEARRMRAEGYRTLYELVIEYSAGDDWRREVACDRLASLPESLPTEVIYLNPESGARTVASIGAFVDLPQPVDQILRHCWIPEREMRSWQEWLAADMPAVGHQQPSWISDLIRDLRVQGANPRAGTVEAIWAIWRGVPPVRTIERDETINTWLKKHRRGPVSQDTISRAVRDLNSRCP